MRLTTACSTLMEDVRGNAFFANDDSVEAPFHRNETLQYTERSQSTVQLKGQHTLEIFEHQLGRFLKTGVFHDRVSRGYDQDSFFYEPGGLLSASWFYEDVADPIEYVQRFQASLYYMAAVNYPEIKEVYRSDSVGGREATKTSCRRLDQRKMFD